MRVTIAPLSGAHKTGRVTSLDGFAAATYAAPLRPNADQWRFRHEIRAIRRGAGQGWAGRRQLRLSRFRQLCCRGREARLFERVFGRAPFHRLWPGVGVDEPPCLSGGAHRAHSPRHRRRRLALAQPDPGRRAGRHPRPPLERAPRFRRRQGLSRIRIPGLLYLARGGDRALRRGDGGDPQGLDFAGPVLLPGQALAFRQCRRRAEPDPAAAPAVLARRRQRRIRSAAPRARATTCCSTRLHRPI